MNNKQFLMDVAMTGRILGSLFYYSPDKENNPEIIEVFQSGDWQEEWPVNLSATQFAEINQLFESGHEGDESLQDAWQRLFIGPYALPAPPWGSVWLDKEKILFGDSTVELRQWMRDKHIQPVTSNKEPEDHIGLLFMLAAWLAEENRPQDLAELLAEHLLPWATHYLCIFAQVAESPFYIGIAKLSIVTLAAYQQQLTLPVTKKPLYS